MINSHFQDIIFKFYNYFTNSFSILENILLEVSETKVFKNFLSEYRGRPVSFIKIKKNEAKIRNTHMIKIIQNLPLFFKNCFYESIYNDLMTFSQKDILYIINECEKICNLSIYYWNGLNDKNYQFRAIVHFFELDGMGAILFNINEINYYTSFSEFGIRFGIENDEHIPNLLPMHHAWMLNDIDIQNELTFIEQKQILGNFRFIQKELTMLIDEWEYRNTILSIICSGMLWESNEVNSDGTEKKTYELQLMSDHRNFFANIMLDCYIELTKYLIKIYKVKNLHADIYSEIEVINALILASMQKILLPAAVSRHEYTYQIINKMLNYIKLRRQIITEDISLYLFEEILKSILPYQGNKNNYEIIEPSFLSQKTYMWHVNFNIAIVFKSMSWMYSEALNNIYSILFLYIVLKKTDVKTMLTYLEFEIKDVLNMPKTFCSYATSPSKIKGSYPEWIKPIVKEILVAIKSIEIEAGVKNKVTKILQKWENI